MIENLSAFKRLFSQASDSAAHAVPLGVVAFAGADAQAFLQGQLTCDVHEVTAGRARYAGYCTPKGRLLMLGLLARAPGNSADAGYWLVTDAGLVPELVKRLRMYVLRSRVVVSVPTLDLAGFTDLPAGGPLDEIFAATPLDAGGLALRYPGGDPGRQRVLAIVPRAAGAAGSGEGADAATPPAPPDPAWRAADVAAGLAWIEPASREVFVPQALDLGRVPGTLSFTKGCFPGQEIVARVHWLGQVKRGLFRVEGASLPPGTAVAPGAPVHDAGGQPVGEWVGAGGSQALASLRLDVASDPGRLGFTATPALPAQDLGQDPGQAPVDAPTDAPA